jgi:hypothetical protein
MREWWIIEVGGGYGAFNFFGTEDEAEEMRRHKANWEHAVARKRRGQLLGGREFGRG